MTSALKTHLVVEIPIKAYYITAEDMNEAMRRYPDLVDRLWRVCGVRIAVPLLLDVPNYYNWSKDKIRIMCERSFIATLPKGPNAVFKANEQMKEVFDVLLTKYSVEFTTVYLLLITE